MLASLWWGKRGILVSIALSANLLISQYILNIHIQLYNNIIRVCIFIFTSILFAFIKNHITCTEDKLKKQTQEQEHRLKQFMCIDNLTKLNDNPRITSDDILKSVIDYLNDIYGKRELLQFQISHSGKIFNCTPVTFINSVYSSKIFINGEFWGTIDVYASKKDKLPSEDIHFYKYYNRPNRKNDRTKINIR